MQASFSQWNFSGQPTQKQAYLQHYDYCISMFICLFSCILLNSVKKYTIRISSELTIKGFEGFKLRSEALIYIGHVREEFDLCLIGLDDEGYVFRVLSTHPLT